MRVWDVPPQALCRSHLLGQHNEIHGLWTVITEERTGYSRHPETTRWRGRLKALFDKHQSTADEMMRRGYNHQSDLDETLATGESEQTEFVDVPETQAALLRERCADCKPWT